MKGVLKATHQKSKIVGSMDATPPRSLASGYLKSSLVRDGLSRSFSLTAHYSLLRCHLLVCAFLAGRKYLCQRGHFLNEGRPILRLYTTSDSNLVSGKRMFVEEALIEHPVYQPTCPNLYNELHSCLFPPVSARSVEADGHKYLLYCQIYHC